MAITRSRDPLHNLTQTACDLALYLTNIDRNEFNGIVESVRIEYSAPKESWIWSPFYMYSRGRVSALKEMLDAKENSISEVVLAFLSEGGWEETSANTNLLRKLVKKLNEYDQNVTLKPNEIFVLKELLVEANQNKLPILQAEENLRDLEEQIQQCKLEIEKARQTLLLLNPQFDIEKLATNQIQEVMQEAKSVGEAAIKTYIRERDEILRKKRELEDLRESRIHSNAKSMLAGQNVLGQSVQLNESLLKQSMSSANQTAKIDSTKNVRNDEVTELCKLRDRTKDSSVKSQMENLFKKKLSESVAVAVPKPIVVSTKPRAAFKDVKIKEATSANPDFQRKVEMLKAIYTPKLFLNPEKSDQEVLVEQAVCEFGKR